MTTSVFGKLNLKKKIEKESKSQKGDMFGNVKFLELQDGKNRIRILPPMAGSEDFELKTFRHYGIGAESKQNVLCPKRTFGSRFKCPICEAVSALYNSKDQGDRELAKELTAKQRNFANVLNLDEDADPKNVYLFAYGYKISGLIMKKIQDPEYGDITDIDSGYNLTLEKYQNQARQNDYILDVKKQCPAPTFDESQATNLLTLFQRCLTYDALKAVMEGGDTETAMKDHGVFDMTTGAVVHPDTAANVATPEKPPAKTTKPAPPADDDDPPAKPSKPAPSRPAPVVDDDDPPAKIDPRFAKSAKPTPPADDDDQEPAPAPRRPAAKPAADDDDTPPARPPAKPRPPVDDQDDAPPAKTTKPTPPAADDDDDNIMAMLRSRAKK